MLPTTSSVMTTHTETVVSWCGVVRDLANISHTEYVMWVVTPDTPIRTSADVWMVVLPNHLPMYLCWIALASWVVALYRDVHIPGSARRVLLPIHVLQ